MSEGRPVSNLNQHESIYGTILEEPGNLGQIAGIFFRTDPQSHTKPTLQVA